MDIPAVDWALVARLFITVLLVMDPLGTIPVFLTLTRAMDDRGRARAARQATVGAAGIILVFAMFGEKILAGLGITLPALQVAGGLLLLIIALELLQVVSDGDHGPDSTANVALVPLATPLLAGPGAIATVMVGVREAGGGWGSVHVAAALIAVFCVVFVALRAAGFVARRIPEASIHLVSRVMGLLVAAIAVQLVADGITAWVVAGGA